MEKQIIILAKSWRNGGYCIAGKCTKTGEWIRPICSSDNEAIPKTKVQNINLCTIVKINLKGKCTDEYQCENYLIDSSAQNNWKVIGKASMQQIEKLCEPSEQVFHSNSSTTDITQMPTKDKGKSLTLIKVNINFKKDEKNGKPDWRGYFYDGNSHELKLWVTDPEACKQLDYDSSVIETACYLTISLAKLGKGVYTKLIAGVIWPDKYQK